MMPWRVLAVTALLATHPRLPAQFTLPTFVVSGVVFDSVGRTPLAGAIVQVALVDARPGATPDSTPRTFWTTADGTGQYRIAGLPAGRFAIGFQHDALAALGLESPLRAFELAADSAIRVDLAIPAGDAVRAQRCGKAAGKATDGMLAGYVFDARQSATLAGAIVDVSWVEIAFDKDDLRTVPSGVTARVSEDGTYIACGVTSDAPVSVRVTSAGFREILGAVSVPAGGAMRQDFRLADSTAVRGAGVLAGRVLHADGAPLIVGRAVIAGLAIEVPVLNGAFSMTGVPAGTWVVEAQAIGYEPQSALVEFAEQSSAATSITLTRRATMLGAINVIGKPSGGLKVLDDIQARSRVTSGTIFLPGSQALKNALTPTDVLKGAPGFNVVSVDEVRARGCGGGSEQSGKRVAVYLDGMRFVTGLAELKNSIPMKDILAIEAYQDVAMAPLQWRNNDTCAVIAVWSRR